MSPVAEQEEQEVPTCVPGQRLVRDGGGGGGGAVSFHLQGNPSFLQVAEQAPFLTPLL